jgi:hypothetical protein
MTVRNMSFQSAVEFLEQVLQSGMQSNAKFQRGCSVRPGVNTGSLQSTAEILRSAGFGVSLSRR